MKDKAKETRIIQNFADAMGRTVDYAAPMAKELLGVPIEEMFQGKEEETLRKCFAEFKAIENELNHELEKNKKNLGGGIDKYRVRSQHLKQQKSKVGSKIASAITADADVSDLFMELQKVSVELRETEDLITAIEKQSNYPELESVKAIGKRLFDAGIKVINASIVFRDVLTQYEARSRNLTILKDSILRDVFFLKTQASGIEKTIIRAYGLHHTDIASGTWQQLDDAARKEIDSRIGEVR